MRRIAILDAPSNLGLRPPTATSVPGCAKAPGALRDHGLLARLAARDAGCVTPPRYDPGDWRPGDGVAHAHEIAWYSRRLADRIDLLLDAGDFPVVLGGDCSILLGAALAMRRRSASAGAPVGLIYVDAHSDFRHPGNASYVGAAAGEDLALATGRGQGDLAAMDNHQPYFRDSDVVVLGIRSRDEYRLDLQAAGIAYRAVPQLRSEGAARSAQWARGLLADCLGYWVHVDVDVLDPAVMPAVDAPDAGGIAYSELELLLAGLVATPRCLGIEITVFDPDYDPTGVYAEEIVQTLVAGLAPAAAVAPLDWATARSRLARAVPLPRSQPGVAPSGSGRDAVSSGSGRDAVSSGSQREAIPSVTPQGATPSADVAAVEAPAGDPAHAAARVSGAAAAGGATTSAAGGTTTSAAGGATGTAAGGATSAAAAGGATGEADAAHAPGAVRAADTADADGARMVGSAAEGNAPASGATVDRRGDSPPRRPAATRGRSGRDRSSRDVPSFSDMADADRAALARRRSGAAGLRGRDDTDGQRRPEEAGNSAESAPMTPPRPRRDGVQGSTEAATARDPERKQIERPFAGLAEQVRAAVEQVPSARASTDPPAVPAVPPEASESA